MFLDDVPINYLGVLIAAIIYFIIGAIWYSPFLFGNQCEKRNENFENVEEGKVRCCSCKAGSFIGEFFVSLIIAYVLALFIQISRAGEIVEGITIAFWIWLGFVATTHFSAVLWDRKTVKHYLIHTGFMLVGFLSMGAFLIYFS